jgi:RNA polymerase sigma-70 factor (ECF subfamily)
MMSQIQEVQWGRALSFESELTRLRGGDVEAIAALLERYQHRLYRYLLRIVRRPETAEDLFQQTWLRVMEKIRSYDPQRAFDGWLFALARNLAIDHLRRYQPESLDEPLPSGDARTELIPQAGPGALEQLLAGERHVRVAECVAGLPLVFREVLTLRFEEEMKLEEMAVVLALPLGTVKTRLHRALKHLRLALEQNEESGRPGSDHG